MKRSWNETRWIDRFLLQKLGLSNRNNFHKRIQSDAAFAQKVEWQQKTYQIIRISGRRKLKKEIQQIEAHLLGSNGDQKLKNQIYNI